MARRRGSASIALILLVLGLVGAAVVVVSLWPALSGSGGGTELRPATAKVLESTSCAASEQGDLVEVVVDGRPHQARYDGCGHSPGQQLDVLVPADPTADFMVRPRESASADIGKTDALRQRLDWVLLTLAGVAAGGYVLMLRWRTM